LEDGPGRLPLNMHPDALTLPPFQLGVYRLTLEARERLTLPTYKGGVLRGGFGYAFKQGVCVQPDRPHCTGCPLTASCVYAAVFEPAPPTDSAVLRKNAAIPTPFIIEPPPEARHNYAVGELLDFHLVLVGQALGYLPHFLVAFRRLGEFGLGERRGRFRLQQVVAIHPWQDISETIYADEVLQSLPQLYVTEAEIATQAQALPEAQLSIHFLTPTRLQNAGQLVREGPPFAVLVKALLGRISSLAYFHCGARWETDFRAWIDRAETVQIEEAATGWDDWGRFSSRQQQHINMGGLIGHNRYQGQLAPYRALLTLGTLLHVGKGTVFGNGKFTVTE